MKDFIQKNSVIRIIFGIIICGMFMSTAAALLYLPIPEDNRSAVDILIGSLSTLIGMVFTFYFGSSNGSAMKSETIDRVLRQSQNTIQDIVPPFDDTESLNEVEELYGTAPKVNNAASVKVKPNREQSNV